MAKQLFRAKNFGADARQRIATANAIIVEYQRQGLRMTLRQLYYQHVARELIPNNDRSYKALGKLISDGRLAGLIDWTAIEDRGRQPDVPAEWGSLGDLVDAAVRAFRLPRWDGQPNYVELWVEKQALAGVLEPLAREHHVTLMVNKGYSSQSAMYEAARRFRNACPDLAPCPSADDGFHSYNLEEPDVVDGCAFCCEEPQRKPVLLYLGDFDPSGEDMVRDIRERLVMFNAPVDVRKIALTMPQIRQYRPPPNPAKVTDSRARAYIERYGDSSWEVDALPPNILADLIRAAFRGLIDQEPLTAILEREERLKVDLRAATAEIEQNEEEYEEE